jgi:IclR family transcriptional regulator, acetate operon repressor
MLGAMAPAPTRVPPRRSSDVQSVSRAAALLACFADADSGLTLTELSRQTQLTTSTAHRLLGTLCRSGLLCRNPETERFLPGPLLLRLSRSSLLADDLGEIAAHLQALVEETRESACFGVRRGDEVAVLLAASSPEPLRVDIASDAHLDLPTSALGRALLAFGDEPVDAALARLKDPPEGVRVEVLAAQFRGYAVADDDLGAGIRAIAAPLSSTGGVRAALELRGPRERMQDIDGLGRILQRHALEIARLPAVAAL